MKKQNSSWGFFLKRAFIVCLAIILAYHTEQWINQKDSVSDVSAAPKQEHQVILYATSWCPYCDKARRFLKKNKIDYFEYDIEKSAEGAAQYRKLNGRGIPVVKVGKTVIYGYDEQGILTAYKKLKK